uniref:Secreted protein n=1 Tax=Sipha flava TaxID=143950 RepID=A0A2S2Q9L8_9HEMI
MNLRIFLCCFFFFFFLSHFEMTNSNFIARLCVFCSTTCHSIGVCVFVPTRSNASRFSVLFATYTFYSAFVIHVCVARKRFRRAVDDERKTKNKNKNVET